MAEIKMGDLQRIELIRNIVESVNQDNLGDVLVRCTRIALDIKDPINKQRAEYHITNARDLARIAEIGWKLFSKVKIPKRIFEDTEIIQMISIIGSLHELSYCFERMDFVTFFTGENSSTPIRFYLNSVLHYLAAFFLLDRQSAPLGGTIYKVLAPLEMEYLLRPVNQVLRKKYGEGFRFGGALKNIRNNFLVHGDFTPKGTEKLIRQANMHDLDQKILFSDLLWEIFNEVVILKLRIIATLTKLDVQLSDLIVNYYKDNYDDYMETILKP